jgi:hypothetical protein
MGRIRTQAGDVLDEIQQPLYDVYDQLPGVDVTGANGITFFAQGRSGSISDTLTAPGLTTNGTLTANNSFRCTGLQLFAQNYNEVNAQVLPILMESSYINFHVDTKDYWTGNTMLAAGRIWQNAALANPAAASQVVQSLGAPTGRAVSFSRLHTVDIESLAHFYVNWVADSVPAVYQAIVPAPYIVAAATNIRYLMCLFGLYRRAVQ